MTDSSEIRSLGCNEVPKAKGGIYWEGDNPDGREFALGQDSNERRRRAVILDLMFRLDKAGGLRPNLGSKEEIERFLFDRDDRLVADAQIMDSLEYGRSVHAEMNALMDAARSGISVGNCILYSNTFPCHNCAKHIVSAGISEVIYNHPYPKSYAGELFDDSIVVNPIPGQIAKVVFRQFIGIFGPMYARVFTKARWKKDKDTIVKFDKRRASFIRRTPASAYLRTENLILVDLDERLKKSSYR